MSGTPLKIATNSNLHEFLASPRPNSSFRLDFPFRKRNSLDKIVNYSGGKKNNNALVKVKRSGWSRWWWWWWGWAPVWGHQVAHLDPNMETLRQRRKIQRHTLDGADTYRGHPQGSSVTGAPRPPSRIRLHKERRRTVQDSFMIIRLEEGETRSPACKLSKKIKASTTFLTRQFNNNFHILPAWWQRLAYN